MRDYIINVSFKNFLHFSLCIKKERNHECEIQQEWIFIYCFHMQPWVIDHLCYCRDEYSWKKWGRNPWAKHSTHTDWCSSINSDRVITICNLISIQKLTSKHQNVLMCHKWGCPALCICHWDLSNLWKQYSKWANGMQHFWEAFRAGTQGAQSLMGIAAVHGMLLNLGTIFCTFVGEFLQMDLQPKDTRKKKFYDKKISSHFF